MELNESQFALEEGPCLDAFRFECPELHADKYSSEARTESGAGLVGWLAQLCIHLVREPFRVRLDHRSA